MPLDAPSLIQRSLAVSIQKIIGIKAPKTLLWGYRNPKVNVIPVCF